MSNYSFESQREWSPEDTWSLTNDCPVQLLRVLSLWVSHLSQYCIQNIGIWTIQNEMLQKPNKDRRKNGQYSPLNNSLTVLDQTVFTVFTTISHRAATSVSATHMSLFWVTRMAFSTFSSISGRPAYMATTGASLVTPSIWQSVSQPWKHIHAQRGYNNPKDPGRSLCTLWFEIFTSLFLAGVHIPHESFQAPISPGAIDGEDGFWT